MEKLGETEIDNTGETKLTPSQFGIIKKIEKFLSELTNLYKIEGNNIYINDIDVFSKISGSFNDDNNHFFDEISYKKTEIKFFNTQNIVLELDDGEYLKIINYTKPTEYFKYLIKKVLG